LDLDFRHHYLGPLFWTLIYASIWDTLIWDPTWDPDLVPRFGTPIWDPDLGGDMGPRFGTLILGDDMGPPFGTLIWGVILGPRCWN
jgi:hypothetical protein